MADTFKRVILRVALNILKEIVIFQVLTAASKKMTVISIERNCSVSLKEWYHVAYSFNKVDLPLLIDTYIAVSQDLRK
jgi:hypothetical protein